MNVFDVVYKLTSLQDTVVIDAFIVAYPFESKAGGVQLFLLN